MNPNRMSTKDLILYASVGASIAITLINSFSVRTAQKTQLELLIKDKLLTDMCVECNLDHSKIWDEIHEIKRGDSCGDGANMISYRN